MVCHWADMRSCAGACGDVFVDCVAAAAVVRRQYKDLSATLGADGWTAWIWPVHDGYRFRCCDCALVHLMQFTVDDGAVGFRIKRDNRATAASRRKCSP